MIQIKLNDHRIMSAAEACERWKIDSSTLRKRIEDFPDWTIRKFGKQWVVTQEGMEKVFGKLKEDDGMKLYWANHEKYPEDIGYYPAESADDLMERLAIISEKTPDYIREHYLYGEIDVVLDEKNNKKFRVKLEEQ